MLSRWPIAILPQSLYVMDDTGTVNLTIAAATYEIMLSFNKLSTDGIKLREFRSRGAHEVPLLIKFGNLFRYPKFGKVYWESLFQTCFLNHTCWTLPLGCPASFLRYGISWRLESIQTGIQFHPTLQCR